MKACLKDTSKMAKLINQLWPDMTLQEAEQEIENYIDGDETAVFTYVVQGEYIGLALCCLRSDYVEGCEFSPVGYLEGIVVDEKYRLKGIARFLCKECEEWAKTKGCKEFASDCELTNTDSLLFHLRIGFEEENRIICFKKAL